MMAELTKREKDFLDLIAVEIASNCDRSGDVNIGIESIRKAHQAITERVWAMLNDEKLKKNVSGLLSASVWEKANYAEISKKANDSYNQVLNCEQQVSNF